MAGEPSTTAVDAPVTASVTMPRSTADAPGGSSRRSIVQLNEVAVGRVISPERWAGVAGTWADTVSRVAMVVVICVIFIWLNQRVMDFVQQAFDADLRQLAATPAQIKPVERLVTANVLITLIGATVVQVGIAVISIVTYLFPKSRVTDPAVGAE